MYLFVWLIICLIYKETPTHIIIFEFFMHALFFKILYFFSFCFFFVGGGVDFKLKQKQYGSSYNRNSPKTMERWMECRAVRDVGGFTPT